LAVAVALETLRDERAGRNRPFDVGSLRRRAARRGRTRADSMGRQYPRCLSRARQSVGVAIVMFHRASMEVIRARRSQSNTTGRKSLSQQVVHSGTLRPQIGDRLRLVGLSTPTVAFPGTSPVARN